MSQRKAHLDLDWDDQGIPYYEEAPLTFDIPGYEYDHAHSTVAITSQFMDPTFGFAFDIEGLKSPRGEYAQLWNDVDFGVPNGKTVEEMMRAAENITPQEIADALAANNYAPDDVDDDVTASRQATRRTAHMDLDWVESHSTSPSGYDYVQYKADLPAIPGHQGPFHVSVLEQRHLPWSDVPYYEFVVTYDGLPDPVGTVSNEDFGIPDTDSAEEMMRAAENITPQEIADALTAIGDVPLYGNDFDASRKASIEYEGNAKEGNHMIRKATKRKANLNLDWEQDDVAGSWFADLPTIPGYPCADGYSNHVQVADQSGLEGTDWAFYMYLELQKEPVHLYNEDFDIPDTDTAEEMMDIVDNLSVQDIADALQAAGYMPEED